MTSKLFPEIMKIRKSELRPSDTRMDFIDERLILKRLCSPAHWSPEFNIKNPAHVRKFRFWGGNLVNFRFSTQFHWWRLTFQEKSRMFNVLRRIVFSFTLFSNIRFHYADVRGVSTAKSLRWFYLLLSNVAAIYTVRGSSANFGLKFAENSV